MASKKVADVLVDALADAGAERMSRVAGDSLNGITDSIRRHGRVRWIHVRHEEVAAFAAGAEAHLTGKLAVCAGSCGSDPGHRRADPQPRNATNIFRRLTPCMFSRSAAITVS